MEHTINLNLWDPAMLELDTQDETLVDVNQMLRVRFQKEIRFHGVVICFDSTDSNSFTQATAIYKELMKDPEDHSKLSKFAKIPVALTSTKLDLTDYLVSDGTEVPRCVSTADLRTWLGKMHRKCENAVFETSAVENIGVSMMVEWIVKAALRAYPAVEKSKSKKVQNRFTQPIESSDPALKKFLASTGNIPFGDMDDEEKAAFEKKKTLRWNRYVREEAKSAVHMQDICTIF